MKPLMLTHRGFRYGLLPKTYYERKIIMSYDVVYIFTKKGNLMDYLCTDKVSNGLYNGQITERTKASYEAERNLTLMAMFRYETERKPNNRVVSHCLCRIKCPVNPLPVKGEFEAPSASAILEFLMENGWTLERKLHPRMFE